MPTLFGRGKYQPGVKVANLTLISRTRVKGPRTGLDYTAWVVEYPWGERRTVREANLYTLTVKTQKNEIDRNTAMNQILKCYKISAIKRGYAWELTKEQFQTMTAKNCAYCGSKPANKSVHGKWKFIYNGIDRMDNKIGYLFENCVPCCGICNRMKLALPMSEFINHCRRVADHQD